MNLKFTLEHIGKAQKGSRGVTTLSLTSALLGVWVISAKPWPLYPREFSCTHCIGGWIGPRAGLDRCGKSRLHRDSIPGPYFVICDSTDEVLLLTPLTTAS